ncbi:MAG: hypothetical protein MI749_04750 [Desulfovibrionales bacterium]|nr:hypothetical protein [Desulfovibrionales bacterium]
MSYGFYDTQRVEDKTAHQAIVVLRMNSLSREETELDKLQEQIDIVVSNNEDICRSLRNLGKPSYTPTYMIQHGIRALTGQNSNDGLVKGFDSKTAWRESLKMVPECG